MANFYRIRSIRSFLNRQAAETLLLGLCISHLDCSNAMLYGVPDVDINHLQRVQSMCAKLVLNHNPYSSSMDALVTLHWLPIRARITFKLMCIAHRCKYGIAPAYLKDLLISPPIAERDLHSSKDTTKLIVPFTKNRTFALRSFSVAGPAEWNSLPISLRETTSYKLFKKNLKTHLSRIYYS